MTRAWCSPNGMGAGTVVVRFVRDDDDDPIPDSGERESVRAHIEAQRPVTAELFVPPTVAKPVAYVISNLEPDTAEIRAAVVAELKDMHIRDAMPGGTLLRTHMSEAISIATGENDHVLVSPAGNVTSLPGELATFGSHVGVRSVEAWREALLALLPPGAMFNRQPGGVLVRVLEAFGASMRAVERLAVSLVAQFDPLLADELLDDWEQLYDLPDECLNAPVGKEQRRQRVNMRRLMLGGSSRSTSGRWSLA